MSRLPTRELSTRIRVDLTMLVAYVALSVPQMTGLVFNEWFTVAFVPLFIASFELTEALVVAQSTVAAVENDTGAGGFASTGALLKVAVLLLTPFGLTLLLRRLKGLGAR